VEVRLEILGPVDQFGRAHFVLYWQADNIGPACNETGERAQHFFAVPPELVP
jgi:hypothetical protein